MPRITVNYIMHSNRDPRRVRARQRLDIRGVADLTCSCNGDLHYMRLPFSLGSLKKPSLRHFQNVNSDFARYNVRRVNVDENFSFKPWEKPMNFEFTCPTCRVCLSR